jgi:hypothetical protein
MNVSNDRLSKPKYIELPDELAAQICGGTIAGVHKVPDVTLKRGTFGPDYFDGRLLTAADLNDDQRS